MDAKFYQFWSDFIKQAAVGQISSTEFTAWMCQGPGVRGIPNMSDKLTAMFKKYYGLDQMPVNAPDYSTMVESAFKQFNHSLTNLYSILDVVPKQDYLNLEKKYTVLKRKMADLEEVVRQLKLLFKVGKLNTEEGIGPLNQMLKNQNEQFLKMMDSLAGFYGITKETDSDEE